MSSFKIQERKNQVRTPRKGANINVIEYKKVEKENVFLCKILKEKEEEIFRLTKTIADCTCLKYNQSMDDLVMLAVNNQEELLELKKQNEIQKFKMLNLKEEKTCVMNQMMEMELEMDADKRIVGKLELNIENLKNEVKANVDKIQVKDDLLIENEREITEFQMKFEFLKTKLIASLKDNQLLEMNLKSKIEKLENEIVTLKKEKEDRANENLNETLVKPVYPESLDLLEELDSLKMKNKDLEDEITVKNEELNRREKITDKEENSSSSSLAEEIQFVVHGNGMNEFEDKVKSFVSKIEKLVKHKAERNLWELERKKSKHTPNFCLNDGLYFDWNHF